MVSNPNMDKAFKLFHEKKFKKAKQAFDQIVNDDSVDAWIKMRIRQFITISDLASEGGDQTPEMDVKTVSYLLNQKAYDKAEGILEKLDISKGDKLFLRAEIAMERKDSEKAVTYLRQAIEADPNNRGYALNSPSFAESLKLEEFQFLREKKN